MYLHQTKLALWRFHGIKGWWRYITFRGSVSQGECASRWRHIDIGDTKNAVATKGRLVVFKTCITHMKLKVAVCKCSLFEWNINTLMIWWDHMWSTYFICFTIIILMLHIDVFLNLMILPCFHNFFSHHTFMVQIHDLMNVFIFNWFYHHYWMSNNLISCHFCCWV